MPDWIEVELVFSPAPGQVEQRPLRVLAGCPVSEVLRLAGVDLEPLRARHGAVEIGIWGRRAALDTPLRDHDRVELYRGLTVDPKEARRLRYRGQRAAKSVKGTRRG